MPRKKRGNETEEEKATREAAEKVREEESKRRKQEQLRAMLAARQQEDASVAEGNERQIDDAWRRLMRRAKVEELRAEVDLTAQWFERQLERRDAALARANAELDGVEEQFRESFRAHERAIDELLELHARSLDRLRADFDAELTELRRERGSEMDATAAAQRARELEMRQVIGAMEAEWRSKQAVARRELAQSLQEANEKTGEELVRVREQLDAKIEASQAAFEKAAKDYQRDVGPLLEDFGRAYEVDQQNVRTLKGNERRLARLQEAIGAWRSKLAAASADFEREQQRLKDEREMVAEHFGRLKSRMARFREVQRQRLLDMTKSSAEAMKALDAKLETAEKILRTSALNERLLTEEETVLGFQTIDQAVPIPGSQLPEAEAGDDAAAVGAPAASIPPATQPASQYCSFAVARDGTVVDETGLLEGFFRRYNRALADTEALEREAEQLRKENADIEAILLECEQGETLKDGSTPAGLGTLLVVNERLAPRIKVMDADRGGQQAGGAAAASHVVLMQSTAPQATRTKTT